MNSLSKRYTKEKVNLLKNKEKAVHALKLCFKDNHFIVSKDKATTLILIKDMLTKEIPSSAFLIAFGKLFKIRVLSDCIQNI